MRTTSRTATHISISKSRGWQATASRTALLLTYLLGHPCVDCGENDPLVLDFDHRDPASKRKEVGRLANTKAWPQVLAEIEKCDVRCANCHRRRTAQQFAWSKLTRKVTVGLVTTLVTFDKPGHSGLGSTIGTRTCCTCKQTKALSEFAVKNAERGTRSTKCKPCQAAYSREHYKRNRATYLRSAAERRQINREACRQHVFDYLSGHPCVDCGEHDPILLEFDHRDRSTKRGSISRLMSSLTWAALELEIARCDIRCANCHRRRTAQQFGWAKLQERSA